jgi:hypothetical protein
MKSTRRFASHLLFQPEAKDSRPKNETEAEVMARPKQKKELKRGRKATIMYTADEYAEIEANAKETEVTVSEFIRAKSLRGQLHVPKYAKIDTRTVNELSRQGALLKTYFNVTGGQHKEKTAAILDDMAAIVLEIRGHLNDRKAHPEPEK